MGHDEEEEEEWMGSDGGKNSSEDATAHIRTASNKNFTFSNGDRGLYSTEERSGFLLEKTIQAALIRF